MKPCLALALVSVLLAGCSHATPKATPQVLQRVSFVAPAGFSPAKPDGPCRTDPALQCWTSKALPRQAVTAASGGLRSGFRMTDASFCSPTHWGVQRSAWGEAHTPCLVRGTSGSHRVVIEASTFPDRVASIPGHLVFLPTLVSISTRP